MGGEVLRRGVSDHFIMAKDLDTLMPMECTYDLRVHPGNGRELCRPVRFVVRPGDPGSVVAGAPRRGSHPPAPRYLLQNWGKPALRPALPKAHSPPGPPTQLHTHPLPSPPPT